MPDFVNSTANSDFMKKIKGHILPFDCGLMLHFEMLNPELLQMRK